MAADVWGTAGTVLLGVVLAFAAGSKLSRSQWAQLQLATGALTGVRDARVTRVVAAGSLAAELVVAAVCILGAGNRAGSVLFVALMAVYLAVVAHGYVRNVQVPCACFGRSSQDLLALKHVVRNGLLLAAGVAVVAVNDMKQPTGARTVATWIAIALVAMISFSALVVSLSTARRAAAAHALPVASPPHAGSLSVDGVGLALGARLPELSLTGDSGQAIDTGPLRSRQLVIAFFVPNCPSCADTVEQLSELVGRYDVLAAVLGPPLRQRDSLVGSVRDVGVRAIVVDAEAERLADACEVDLFPTLLYVDRGVVAELPRATDSAR